MLPENGRLPTPSGCRKPQWRSDQYIYHGNPIHRLDEFAELTSNFDTVIVYEAKHNGGCHSSGANRSARP